MLEGAQPPGLVDFESSVLGLPPVERLLANGVAPAQIGALRPGLGLLQDPDDLFLGEPLALRRGAALRGILAERTLIRHGPVFGEQVAKTGL